MTAQGFHGWRVVGAAFTLAVLAWGIGFYAPAVFLHALHNAHGWSVGLVSAAITLHFVASAGIVARLPALHARHGLVAVTRAGGLALGLGAIAWGAAQAPWQLFPAALVSGLGWALTSGAAINAMVAPWFDRRRPAAIAMAFNGASVGGLVFTPLWTLLIGLLGLRPATCVVGLAAAAIVWMLSGRYLGATPASLGQQPDGAIAPVGLADRSATGAMLRAVPSGGAIWRDRRFATLSIAFALGLFAQIGLIAHLFSLLAGKLGADGAAAAVSLTTAAAVAGRSLLGWLLPARADRRIAAGGNFAVQLAGSLVLATAGANPVQLLLGCVLFGLGVGNMISIPPLVAQAEFARADTARVVALVTAVNQAVFAFAPAAFGLLRDVTGDGTVMIGVAAGLQALAALVVLKGRHL